MGMNKMNNPLRTAETPYAETPCMASLQLTQTQQPYTKYKPSGIAWLGDIAEHWEVRKLKYISQITTGSKDTIDQVTDGIYPFYVRSKSIKKINSFAYEGEPILTVGDGDICKIWHYVNGKFDFHQRVYKIFDFKDVNGKFLYYHLLENFQHDVLKLSAKSTVDSLRRPMFTNFYTCFPASITEQTAIAAFLDYKTAKIDRFIRKKKQLLILYAERRKSLTRELINSRNVKYLRLSSVAKLIQRPIEGFENKFYTPVGLYNKGRGLFHKEATLGKELGDSTFFYLQKGDVILSGQFAWEGAVALVGMEDEGCVASHRYPVLDCDLNHVLPEFLFSFFTISEGHVFLDYHSRGAAGRNRPLNPRYLIKEKIPVPDISLQSELIELIKKENELKALIEKEIALTQEYRTALIAEAVTGKIDVREYEFSTIEEEIYEELEDELDITAEDEAEYKTQEAE
jgi:type I restriction enzyme, S subunit